MATATKETDITITLVMDESEANMIRDLTRNHLGTPGDESEDHLKDRMSIFNAIDTGLKKRK